MFAIFKKFFTDHRRIRIRVESRTQDYTDKAGNPATRLVRDLVQERLGANGEVTSRKVLDTEVVPDEVRSLLAATGETGEWRSKWADSFAEFYSPDGKAHA